MGKIKRSVSAILSVLMAASVLTTAPVSAATVEASDAGANVAETQQAELKIAEGSCGDKLTWTLGNDGVLEISGEGKMYDFDFEAKEDEQSFNPWTLYRDQIKKVVVKDGVEYIGNFAFFGFAELEEAQIADSVKEIGENAFEGCDKLDKTTLPEAFTEPATEEVTEVATEEETIEAVAEEAVVEETTKNSPIVVKDEEEAVGAAAEEAVGATAISSCTITLGATSYTYDGNAKKPSVTVKNGSKTLVKGTDYTIAYKNNINAGTATVTVTGKGSYSGSVAKNYTISRRAITYATIKLDCSSYIYDGNIKTPTVTASYNSKNLKKDQDFGLAYKNNRNAGQATVTIVGVGNFTGSVTKNYDIQKKSIDKCTITISPTYCDYNGKRKTVDITVKDGDKVLKIGSDFGPTYEKNIDAGTAYVTITGIGNYGGSVKKAFRIDAKMISKCTFSVNKSSVVYNGTAQKPEVTVKDPDLNVTLQENKDYVLSYARNIDKGTATVYIIGIGNYVSTVWCYFTITAKPISNCSISINPSSATYDATAKTPAVTVKDGATVLTKGTDYSVSYKNNVKAGNASVVITGMGNYGSTATKTLVINKRNISNATVTFETTQFEYDGTKKQPKYTVKDGNRVLNPGNDYGPTFTSNVNAGTATLTLTGLGNYEGKKSYTFKINAKPLTDSMIKLKQTSFKYDGTAKKADVVVTDGTKTLVKGTDYTLTYYNYVDAGTASVIVKGIGNYSGLITKYFNIYPKSISDCESTLSPDSMEYNGGPRFPGVHVKDGNKVLERDKDYSINYGTPWNIGTYIISITGIGNYSGASFLEFKVTPRKVADIPFIDLERSWYVYDGTPKRPKVSATYYGDIKLIEGVDYTLEYINDTKIGTATVVFTGIGKYCGSLTFNYTISKTKPTFTFGTDNWNFINSDYYFTRNTYRNQMLPEHIEKLKENLSNTEYEDIFEGKYIDGKWQTSMIDSTWKGSCYGMSCTAFLTKKGVLQASDFDKNAKTLNDLDIVNGSPAIKSIITYYQMLNLKEIVQSNMKRIFEQGNTKTLNSLFELINNHGCVVLSIHHDEEKFGHSILAYGYEYGRWTKNGKIYNVRFLICDPNTSSNSIDKEDTHLYLNTSSEEWEIPYYYQYWGINSKNGMYIAEACVDEHVINSGGYKSSYFATKNSEYYSRIKVFAMAEDSSIEKVELDKEGNYVEYDLNDNEIVEAFIPSLDGSDKGTPCYNLYDADASYLVSQENTQTLDLSINYENCTLSGASVAGKSVVFDKDGYVSVEGDVASYDLSMTFNDSYATDWFTIHASGDNAEKASLKMVDGGYVLSADKLENVQIHANNKSARASTYFSTEYDSVFIYEIDENTIGLRIDADNNGTYETELPSNENKAIRGDVNLDGVIDILDAYMLQNYIAEFEELSDAQLSVADANNDGVVSVDDSLYIQLMLAELV